MKNKVIILIVILIILISIGILTAILVKINNSDTNIENININNVKNEEITDENKYTGKIEKVNDISKFYTVVNCVNTYLDIANINNTSYYKVENNNRVQAISTEEVAKKIYNIISKEYIEKKSIKVENVFSNIDEVKEKMLFIPLKMNVSKSSKVDKYVVYGILENLEYKYQKDIYLIVNLDIENNTFSIEPIKEEHKDIKEISIENKNMAIEINDNNKYNKKDIKEENVAIEYMNTYKRLALGKPELAYQLLDEEYKNKRFGSLDEYKKYIEKNIKEVKAITVDKYLVNKKEDGNEYVCKDKYENIYVFASKDIMDYKLKLDTYTILSNDFKNEYNSQTEEGKVSMNTDIVTKMINSRDYYNMYKLLDEEYRNNYFKTEDEFTNYMNNMYPKHYTYVRDSITKEGNTFIQKIFLTDITKVENFKNGITLNMQLKEGLDYKISFLYISQE